MTGHEWDKLYGQTVTIDYARDGKRYEGVKVMAGRDNFPYGFCERRDTGFAWMTCAGSHGIRNITALDITKVTVLSATTRKAA